MTKNDSVRKLLGQAGRGLRLLERKEGAMSAFNAMPKECGINPLENRETWKA